ncbi:hypothetical protein Poli38472_002030 [Pythium oligandrum]|uniref:LCCL domain-containing protein n=1 Tax=Pythium oligandrum TaxID=41045 RepID=A0A8K1FJG1_PYTOL|nr:hypothetical protein Poli38472_002030 [Pythium oligandrum]|eukprot:TMW63089.1 hypothetical protein Poli38472_002030 [Pythium oligandrum]
MARSRQVGDVEQSPSAEIIMVDAPDMSDTNESPVTGTHARLHSRVSSTVQHERHSALGTPRDDATAGKNRGRFESTRHDIVAFFRRHWIVVVYAAVSSGLMILLIYLSFFAAVMTEGVETKPEFLSCRAWSYDTSCGLWGINCRPFETEWTPIRCRARCTLDQSSKLAVYGSGKYRADSRICKAAIHAGAIGHNGGCALLRYAGSANSFVGTTANGITSEGYNSWFPKTMEFQAASSRYCTDLTWPILAIGFVIMFGYSFVPDTNPSMLYALLVTWGFFYVRFVGQPPSVDYVGIATSSFGEIFVLLAASFWLYQVAAVHTFASWQSFTWRQRSVRWGLCYVTPFHVLINMNLFEYIPWLSVDLGGYEKSNANAGTYVIFAVVGIAVLFCAFQFLRQLYRQALWKQFVVGYSAVVAVVLCSWALLSSTDFHLHHTMLGAFLMPVTRFSTPLAAFAQSAALGCFIQGYAAWGWTSYLDTIPTYLTIQIPNELPVALNVTSTSANISWMAIDGVDGYSLRINQVEVYRGVDNITVVNGLQPNMTYFITVAGVAEWGTDGQEGPESNFTTPAT